MVVIALDASHSPGSVALARGGDLVASDRFGEGASHLVGLGQTVDGLLAAHSLSPRDIDRVALVAGPGSFTGLRIALAWVKGLHAALGMDVVTVGTLELLALPFLHETSPVCAMIDARRGEVYGALYRARNGADGPPCFMAEEVIAPVASDPERFLASVGGETALFVGTGAAAYRSLLDVPARAGARYIIDEPGMFPSTPHLASVAHQLEPLVHDRIGALEPVYLRAAGATRTRLGPLRP